MPLKIVHCADLHIGAPCSALPASLASVRGGELREAFTDIIKFSKEHSVDALLICGDLFDCPNPSEADCEFVKNAFITLAPIPVYIICGNHDYMCPGSPFADGDYFPENVHVFPCSEHSFSIPDKNAVIYGKSYSSSVTAPGFTDTVFDASKLNILCLHGDLDSLSDYNAVLPQALSSSHCNYAAFGHIHNGEIFRCGNIICAYPGTPEGHRFNDDGVTGFIYAEIDEKETKLSQISLTKRKYCNITYDVTGQNNEEISLAIKEIINSNNIYKITLLGECTEEISIEFIKEEIESKCFYAEIYDNTSPSYDFDSIENEESLRGEFLRQLRKLSKSEEEFILCGKAGLDALSGKAFCTGVEI